ncbi:MAG TPA: transaldolase family protein, partial [Bryobacteraceae bacterium]|nr:transaldolase family protein [Bryobacteraceae bacterium]
MATTTTTTTGTANPLRELSKYGQSAWLDYIRRSLITGGELKRLVDEDGVGGLTSNPAIFEKAITGSTDYTEALVELQKRKDLDAMGVYEVIAIKDIQDVADALRPVYER